MGTKARDIQIRLQDPRDKIFVPELFDELVKLKNRKERIDLLRQYYEKDEYHKQLIIDTTQCLYHPAVLMELPDGVPPFKTEYIDYNMAPNQLGQTYKRVKYFVRGHSEFIQNKLKREVVYIQQLEGMYKDDAELFLMVKDKKLTGRWKILDEVLFRSAFPHLLPELPAEEKSKPAAKPTKAAKPKTTKTAVKPKAKAKPVKPKKTAVKKKAVKE